MREATHREVAFSRFYKCTIKRIYPQNAVCVVTKDFTEREYLDENKIT